MMESRRQVRSNSSNEHFFNYAWYFGKITRESAETILLQNGENPGTFLVRDAVPQTNPPSYRISELDFVDLSCVVYHYQIYCLDCGLYFVDNDKLFSDIPSLIRWYSENLSSKVKVKLSIPCSIRHLPTSYFEDPEVSILSELPEVKRKAITMREKIYSSKVKEVNIWKGSLNSYSLPVAIKTLSPLAGGEAKLRLFAEAKALNSLRHTNIVHLFGVVVNDPVCVVTEFHEYRDLLTYFLNGDAYEITLCQSIRMAHEIASALNYISSKQYVHRNVRARNVLLSADSTCKLSGFGYIAELNKYGKYFKTEDDLPFEDAMCRWMAVESITSGRFSSVSDVWSFAILLYEIFTKGEMPYADVLTPHVCESVRIGYRLHRASGIPVGVYNIMTKCWMADETLRPSFSDIIMFLKEVVPNEKQRHLNNEGVIDSKPSVGKRSASISR